MKKRVLIALTLSLVWASPVSAHMLASSKPPRQLPAKQQLGYAVATISHARAEIKLAKARISFDIRSLHPRSAGWTVVWSSSVGSVLARNDLPRARLVLRNHRWLLGYGKRLQSLARSRLNPWKVPKFFYDQAMCVHYGPDGPGGFYSGEGAWTADTGTYGGGLQFAVGTWNHAASLSHGKLQRVDYSSQIAAMPPMAQIYAAYLIVVVEGSGWGQWPTTAAVCGYL